MKGDTMADNHAYVPKEIRFLKEFGPGRSVRELTVMFNRAFPEGRPVNPCSIDNACVRYGVRIARKRIDSSLPPPVYSPRHACHVRPFGDKEEE
jgi:hypothetical protein